MARAEVARHDSARDNHSKKSASLRQHTLDDRPSCRNTGNVMAVSPGTYSFGTGLSQLISAMVVGMRGARPGFLSAFIRANSRQAHFWLPGLPVAQRISIRNAL